MKADLPKWRIDNVYSFLFAFAMGVAIIVSNFFMLKGDIQSVSNEAQLINQKLDFLVKGQEQHQQETKETAQRMRENKEKRDKEIGLINESLSRIKQELKMQ